MIAKVGLVRLPVKNHCLNGLQNCDSKIVTTSDGAGKGGNGYNVSGGLPIRVYLRIVL